MTTNKTGSRFLRTTANMTCKWCKMVVSWISSRHARDWRSSRYGPKVVWFHTTSRELETCTFQGLGASKTPPKFHEKTPPPKRGKKEYKLCRETGRTGRCPLTATGLPRPGAAVDGIVCSLRSLESGRVWILWRWSASNHWTRWSSFHAGGRVPTRCPVLLSSRNSWCWRRTAPSGWAPLGVSVSQHVRLLMDDWLRVSSLLTKKMSLSKNLLIASHVSTSLCLSITTFLCLRLPDCLMIGFRMVFPKIVLHTVVYFRDKDDYLLSSLWCKLASHFYPDFLSRRILCRVQTAPSTGPDVLACSPLFFHPFPFPLIFLWTDSRIENLNWTSQILWWIVSWICGAQHVAFSGQFNTCLSEGVVRLRLGRCSVVRPAEGPRGGVQCADFWIKKCPDFQVVWTHLRYFLVFFWPFLDLSHGSQLSLEDMTFRNTFCHCQWNGIEIHATSNMKLFTMKMVVSSSQRTLKSWFKKRNLFTY